MSLKPTLANLPFVEFWLIPLLFVLIVGLLALFDPQSLPSALCPCIENTP